jgi:hypothetical protein
MADARQLAVAIIDEEDENEGSERHGIPDRQGPARPFHRRLIPKARTSDHHPPPMLVAPVASRKRAQLEIESFEPRTRGTGMGSGGGAPGMGRTGMGYADSRIGKRTMFLGRGGDDLLVEFAKTVSRFSKSSSAPPSLSELTYVVQLANSLYRRELLNEPAVSRLPVLVHWVGVVMERAGARFRLTPTMIASLITQSVVPAPPGSERAEGAERVETAAQLYNHLHRSLSLPLAVTRHVEKEEGKEEGDDEDLTALLKELRLS